MLDHVEDLISAYIDNELDDSERLAVEEHLKVCKHCSTIKEDLLEISNRVNRSLTSVQVPDNFEQKVILNLPNDDVSNKITLAAPIFSFIILAFFTTVIVFFGTFFFKLFSVFLKVGINIIEALMSFISMEPSWLWGAVISSILLIFTSGYSLHRLIRTKTI